MTSNINLKISKPLAVACVILAGFIGWMLSGVTADEACNYDCPIEAPIRGK
jgi:hypothetical protein